MSEQNILNPTPQSQLNPTYSIPHKDPETLSSWQPRSGVPFSRYMMARGMEFDLHWANVPFSTYLSLRQWLRQYERGFFSYFDIDDSRYYSGQCLAEPQFERMANNNVNITATFVVLPKVPMFQYPSNWGVDSVFLEERDDFSNDLVKLTGTWDHQDKNYLIFSEQIDNAAWSREAAVTVTANTQVDPNGGNTADTITTGATAGVGVFQAGSVLARKGFQVTFSVWLKAAANTGASLLINRVGGTDTENIGFTVTNAWQRFTFTHSVTWTGITAIQAIIRITNAATSIFAWGAQLEFGAAATTYTQTVATVAVLLAPSADANQHAGSAYWDVGNVITDAAEWVYFGFGFRLWSYKGPDMGIVQVFLDGVSQGTVDLFAAAATQSAVVITIQNVVLGQHRVKLSPTATKNAGSLDFFVSADAIEVMR
jgi:hypothetical protein